MMASGSIILDLESEPPISADQLTFQDIPHSHSGSGGSSKKAGGGSRADGGYEQTHTFTEFPNGSQEEDEEEVIADSAELLTGSSKKKSAGGSSASFWSFEYYQMFFDVDTRQVLGRMLYSMFPDPRVNYLQSQIRPNADLYGPFWICITLVFSIAVSGNIARYLQDHTTVTQHWHYDFHKVTLAATVIFTYWWLLPALFYALLRWRGNRANYTFTELLCIYGYSLSVYIPVSVLWVVPVQWLQWTVLFIATALSGTVLLFTLWPSIRHDSKQVVLISLAIVIVLHFALATGFLLYFFIPSSAPDSPLDSTTLTPVTSQLHVSVTSSIKPVSAAAKTASLG